MEWYMKAMSSFADFGGRSRRKEYWFFLLIYIIGAIAVGIVETVLGLASGLGWGLLSGLYWLIHIVPGLAVTVRRLHDTGRSGWWILLVLIPFLGPLVLLVFMLIDSEPGANAWGPSPKGPEVVVEGAM